MTTLYLGLVFGGKKHLRASCFWMAAVKKIFATLVRHCNILDLLQLLISNCTCTKSGRYAAVQESNYLQHLSGTMVKMESWKTFPHKILALSATDIPEVQITTEPTLNNYSATDDEDTAVQQLIATPVFEVIADINPTAENDTASVSTTRKHYKTLVLPQEQQFTPEKLYQSVQKAKPKI